jgi:chromosome partitioning protein
MRARGLTSGGSVTKFIAVSNRRGGVGKTTVAMMLAYGMCVTARQRVLVIDLDAQASTSILMMGHQSWRAARDSKRTNSRLLLNMFGKASVNAGDYITRGIGDVLMADGSRPQLDIIPSAHDLDDSEASLIIAQQASRYKVSDVFDQMQDRMARIIRSAEGAYDLVIIDCAPGLSQVVWGALRASDLVVVPYIPDRTAEDNVGWLVHRLSEIMGLNFRTLPNRVSGHDSRAQGIISAIGAKYMPLGIQIPAVQALATALDHREESGTFASKFGAAAQHVTALTDAVLNVINQRIKVAAE